MTASLLEGYTFSDAQVPDEPDTVPITETVEYPCRVCSREAGPYGGKGRKPTLCSVHKQQKKTSGVRVNGKASDIAAQAAKVLVQGNTLIGFALAAAGFFKTAGSINDYQETFEQQAYNALLTDPNLCRTILSTGAKSATVGLVMAYGGMGLAAGSTALMEYREKKEARVVHEEDYDGTSGT